MPELKPLHALGDTSATTATFGDITITESDAFALASIAARRGHEDAMRKAAKSLLGIDLPDIQMSAQGSDYAAFWTGPDQWFIEAPIGTHEDIATPIKAALKDTGSVTEQTGGWVRFEVAGASSIAMFGRLTMLDLATLPVGTASRTSIEHIGSFVIKRGPESFTVLAPRSYAGSMLHALTLAAKSVV